MKATRAVIFLFLVLFFAAASCAETSITVVTDGQQVVSDYLAVGENDVPPVLKQIDDMWAESVYNISVASVSKDPNVIHRDEYSWDRYLLKNGLEICYSLRYDGTQDVLSIYEFPLSHRDIIPILSVPIRVMAGATEQEAQKTVTDFIESHFKQDTYQINNADVCFTIISDTVMFQIFRYFEVKEPTEHEKEAARAAAEKKKDEQANQLGEWGKRQEKTTDRISLCLDRCIREYWMVEENSLSVTCNFDDEKIIDAIVINLTWEAENSIERTKKMLKMYSDDMISRIHDLDKSVKIKKATIIWKIPYHFKNYPAAKYQYSCKNGYIKITDPTGLLYQK